METRKLVSRGGVSAVGLVVWEMSFAYGPGKRSDRSSLDRAFELGSVFGYSDLYGPFKKKSYWLRPLLATREDLILAK